MATFLDRNVRNSNVVDAALATRLASRLPVSTAPRRIAMLVYPGIAPLDFHGPDGIAAGLDLALALLEQDHGRAFALEVARTLFLKRSGGQAQFSTPMQLQCSSVAAIEKAQRWCHDHLDGDLRVSTLAKCIAMSERNFVRVFRAETGRTPAEFVSSIRLQAACRLLEESGLPTKVAARRCGFGSAAAMRRTFLRAIGVTPAAYRETFNAARRAA